MSIGSHTHEQRNILLLFRDTHELIISNCTIAVAFYTTVPLFSTIAYIQQTNTFLSLIYTPFKTLFIKQMTVRMNIHSSLHFSTMLFV